MLMGLTHYHVQTNVQVSLSFTCYSQDLRGAFYKFDEHHTGRLNRSSFRRMLDAFMCFVNDDEFDKLCCR